MSVFFHSTPEKGDIWSIKYVFDSDTIVRQKDELTGLGCFILTDTLLNKTNMKYSWLSLSRTRLTRISGWVEFLSKSRNNSCWVEISVVSNKSFGPEM
jgi:hypothetical protein